MAAAHDERDAPTSSSSTSIAGCYVGASLCSRVRPAKSGQPGVEVTAPLSVTEMGFSLHAATTASADDSRGREALVRYALRPPIAQERLHLLPNDLVRIELKRPFGDGTVAIDLDPLSLLCRLAASVPPPGFHLVHYAGVLGSAKLTTSNACCDIFANPSNRRNERQRATPRTSRRRCCGARRRS